MAEYSQDKEFLCVGLVVIDMITYVKFFPVEDTKSRAESIIPKAGGNAFTNAKILNFLGEKAGFLGCVGTGHKPNLQFINDSFDSYKIDRSTCVLTDDPMPLTVCLLNHENGSRTCIHYRGSLPELDYEKFVNTELPLHKYKWIHFEGRYDYNDTAIQIEYLYTQRKLHGYNYVISVELEKSQQTLVPLLKSKSDVILVSKDFAKYRGYKNMSETVKKLAESRADGDQVVTFICPWGTEGAAACSSDQLQVVQSCSFPPDVVINTLGAGDTFNASFIYRFCHLSEVTSSPTDSKHNIAVRISPTNLENCLRFGCKIAGMKCGLEDIDELRNLNLSFID